MATVPIDLTDSPIAEKTTQRITFQAVDEEGTALADTDLATLTVTLFDETTKQIINTRTATNILGANGGTFSNGVFAWLMSPLDNAIVDGRPYEYHVVLVQWTYGGGGVKQGRQPIRLMVVNLDKVT